MDRWLIYGTGGAASSDGGITKSRLLKSVARCGGGLIDATGDMDAGWTVGGGAEFAWRPNWTVKAEYLFVRFDGEDYSGNSPYLPPRDPVVYRFSASPASSTSSGLVLTRIRRGPRVTPQITTVFF